MPIAPKRPCQPGCPVLVVRGKCPAHASAYERQRGTSTERGYGYKWQRYSKSYLKQNPHCLDPYSRHAGEAVASTVTDHIKAHKGNMQLFWDKSNHQALCLSCNSYKAVVFEGGFGR